MASPGTAPPTATAPVTAPAPAPAPIPAAGGAGAGATAAGATATGAAGAAAAAATFAIVVREESGRTQEVRVPVSVTTVGVLRVHLALTYRWALTEVAVAAGGTGSEKALEVDAQLLSDAGVTPESTVLLRRFRPLLSTRAAVMSTTAATPTATTTRAPGVSDEQWRQQQLYAASSAVVRDRLEKEGGVEALAALADVAESDVIVVAGNSDKIEQVLSAIGMPHVVIQANTLHTALLNPNQTIYVNCHSGYPSGAAENIAKFVKAGGQLITTDHVLHNLVQSAFPGTITHSGGSETDKVIDIKVNEEESEDDVLRGFAGETKWWLAGGSHPITIVDKARVRVLIAGVDGSPVLVRFHWGDGQVYHMTSHFYLQHSTKPAGASRPGGASAAATAVTAPAATSDAKTSAVAASGAGAGAGAGAASASSAAAAALLRSGSSSAAGDAKTSLSGAKPRGARASASRRSRREADEDCDDDFDAGVSYADDADDYSAGPSSSSSARAAAVPDDAFDMDDAVTYAASRGASKATTDAMSSMYSEQKASAGSSSINYSTVQSAVNSSEFVMRTVLKQKKKAAERRVAAKK